MTINHPTTQGSGPNQSYVPVDLARQILDALERIEELSDAVPRCKTYRQRTGLTCAAEFRNKPPNEVENAITEWVAELITNADAQVRKFTVGVIPDIVFRFDHVDVVLEAKPVWYRWITTGERDYPSAITDTFGRSLETKASAKNIRQVVDDRDKLQTKYEGDRIRRMLFAIVFQRPGELDDRLTQAVGPDWKVCTRHILDSCNPEGDNIGVTGMVFWPIDEDVCSHAI